MFVRACLCERHVETSLCVPIAYLACTSLRVSLDKGYPVTLKHVCRSKVKVIAELCV